MREIKFRAKEKYSRKWVYGYIYKDQRFINGESCCDVTILKTEMGDEYTVIPETVGQFTGLFDEKRRPIYEGDEFHLFFDKNSKGEIIFYEGAFGHLNKISTYGRYNDFVPISKERANSMIIIGSEEDDL